MQARNSIDKRLEPRLAIKVVMAEGVKGCPRTHESLAVYWISKAIGTVLVRTLRISSRYLIKFNTSSSNRIFAPLTSLKQVKRLTEIGWMLPENRRIIQDPDDEFLTTRPHRLRCMLEERLRINLLLWQSASKHSSLSPSAYSKMALSSSTGRGSGKVKIVVA